MFKFRIILATTFISLSSLASASECLLSITRTPCAGKEAEALKPYEGKATTEEKKKSPTADACAKAGEKAAKILRKGTLESKSVVASFDGAAVTGSPFSDKSACN